MKNREIGSSLEVLGDKFAGKGRGYHQRSFQLLAGHKGPSRNIVNWGLRKFSNAKSKAKAKFNI